MESWRGQGRRAGRDALGRLTTAWKADGAGDAGMAPDDNAEQRPAGRPEQALVSMPDRRENTAEHNRVPGWLQTGAAWSWRLLLLAAALYLIARVIGVLYFVAAFVPLVGLLVAGALAILVTLAAKGWVAAVILLVVLIIEDQLEGHLLQPQVVGRVIRLHPLAIILSLAVGGVLAGIAGAVVAVPIVAVITRAVPELRRRDPGPGDP